jgi:hypothetical protein
MKPETVTASEIAEYVFCGESWRRGQIGYESASQPQQQAGTAHHTAKATAETVAGGSIALGRVLIIVALLALVAAILWR